jgi:hypothetical protein
MGFRRPVKGRPRARDQVPRQPNYWRRVQPERLDPSTSGTAGNADSPMEAVGVVNRSAHR